MKQFFVALFIVFTHQYCFGQKLSYEVSFPNIAHHEAHFELTVTDASPKVLTFRMSRSSPGRYATHEFGKNVYDIRAFDAAGKALLVNRIDGDVYQVENKGKYTRIQYTLYANHPDGTYAGIDPDGVHLNIPASFMWVRELEKAPIQVTFKLPEQKKWSVATQLHATKGCTCLYSASSSVFYGFSRQDWIFGDKRMDLS